MATTPLRPLRVRRFGCSSSPASAIRWCSSCSQRAACLLPGGAALEEGPCQGASFAFLAASETSPLATAPDEGPNDQMVPSGRLPSDGLCLEAVAVSILSGSAC